MQTTSLVYNRQNYSDEQLKEFYSQLLLARMIEEKMVLLRRQGRISKWFSGYGQEAISVAAVAALRDDEYILPRIRNLAVFTSRGVALQRLFAQFEAKSMGFTQGRDRTFHFNSLEHHILAAPSLLGPQLEIALGLALSSTLRKQHKVVIAFSGDGESSQGAFHEALNVASVWSLPVLFLIENNGYALSTPSGEQFAANSLCERASGYGMQGIQIEGNNVLEVHRTIADTVASMRDTPRPVLIECLTFRMRGHEEGSGIDYVPEEVLASWSNKDPVEQFEKFLLAENVLNESDCTALRNEYGEKIELARQYALELPEVSADNNREIAAVFSARTVAPIAPERNETTSMRMIDAIHSALDRSMERDRNVILMGQDIAEHGGVFKATKGLLERYGRERVRNTPLCESAILGAAAGLAIEGFRPIVELQFADFSVCGMNQIVNVYSKWQYRSNQELPIVIRLPSGAGVGAGPLHSASYEAWFAHIPGLKLLYPSNPVDAKGLLLTAIEDPNPVLFFEHKALYRSEELEVPTDYFRTPIGKASVVTSGEDASIITYGVGVHWAKSFIEEHPEYSLELIDLRTLIPLDFETIATSIAKTNRALVLYEAPYTNGFGAELAARISEQCFTSLDAPVARVGNLDTPVPQAAKLEEAYLAKSRFTSALEALLAY